jgi:hypothetical protein
MWRIDSRSTYFEWEISCQELPKAVRIAWPHTTVYAGISKMGTD